MTTLPTTRIMTNSQFKVEKLHELIGSSMFPNKYWDCAWACDKIKLKQQFHLKSRILYVLVKQSNDPDFCNIANKDISYLHGVCASKDMDGAYESRAGMWMTNHPIGDAIIVVANKN